MRLKMGTFAAMAKDIMSEQNKIIIFGVGVIGNTVTPEILNTYGLGHLVEFCVDNDKSRWNSTIRICEREIKIYSPDAIKTLSGNVTILVTISRYYAVYEQLKQMECTENMSCYIIPMMCIENMRNQSEKGVMKTNQCAIIPKKIHYMWLGGAEMPDRLLRCIESWKRYCPDYEIIRWDESNYDVHKNKFVSYAYDNKRFGFVPDYARLDILYEHGGIYLDTDVELIKNIDELLYQEAFCGVEKWQVLNFGGCSGAVKGHPTLEPFMKSWESRSLIREDGTIDNISSGLIDTSIALKAGYVINGKNQNVLGMNIYTSDYFHPYDYMSGLLEMTDNTFSIHHFHGGWLDDVARKENEKAVGLYKSLLHSAEEVYEAIEGK